MYTLIAIGGTFDHLHAGHEAFLTAAFRAGQRVLIGLTSDEMASSKVRNLKSEIRNKLQIQNFQTRKKRLELFLAGKGWLERASISKINDVYGPVVERRDVEAMVVSRETLVGARKINRKRRELGLSPLKILTIPFSLAQDRRRISSTRIRGGSIDRVGQVYGHLPIFGQKMPEAIRQRLKQPLGEIITDISKRFGPGCKPAPACMTKSMLITVGDVVTKTMNVIDPEIIDIAIVDYRVNRKVVHRSLTDVGYTPKQIRNVIVTSVKNPPGWMTTTLVAAVKKAIGDYLATGKRQVVRVIGEEDLAGVPAILFAPLGAVVVYGQPGEGMVMVEVTEGKKHEIMKVLGSRF